MSTPITDFWSNHLSMPLGRHFTQTFAADCAPGDTFLKLAWDALEEGDQLFNLADKYVTFNEQRPDKMYSEKILPDGSKIGGYDHGHFGFSVFSEIIQLWPDSELADRAWAHMTKHGWMYYEQKDSYLKLKSKSYGQTGRCRISGMIVRYLCDVYEAAHVFGYDAIASYAIERLCSHIQNIAGQNMCDGKQGDGLLQSHWRSFQVAILMAALERAKLFVSDAYITPLVDRFRPIVEASVSRNAEGKPNGSFWYDVPEPITTPSPWTDLPGWKLGNGNGVELWLYRYLPPDAQAAIRAANPKLPLAVALKYSVA